MPFGIAVFTRAVTKRASRGLFAGKKVLTGNNVSEDGGNRTRRTWKPNAHPAKLYSEILGRMIKTNVTAAALRNIDKAGGLDNYILKTSEKDVDSALGAKLKVEMLERLRRPRKQRNAAAAGLPAAAAEALAADTAPSTLETP